MRSQPKALSEPTTAGIYGSVGYCLFFFREGTGRSSGSQVRRHEYVWQGMDRQLPPKNPRNHARPFAKHISNNRCIQKCVTWFAEPPPSQSPTSLFPQAPRTRSPWSYFLSGSILWAFIGLGSHVPGSPSWFFVGPPSWGPKQDLSNRLHNGRHVVRHPRRELACSAGWGKRQLQLKP